MSLTTIKDLEIVKVGIEYPISTGTVSFTREDIADAVRAANEDPAVKSPRLKLGHKSVINAALDLDNDEAQPALGTVQNIRLSEDGSTAIGDYVGVPKWLAAVMPSAYPSRSFEGNYNHETATGRKYRMVIKAVALLGVVWPGCSTIDDVEALYGDEMPAGIEVAAAEGGAMSFSINASVNVDDIRRQFNDGPGEESKDFLWVQSVYVDPYEIIVMNESEGDLYRYSYTTNSNGEVTFGQPEQVIVQYVPDPLAASEKLALIACSGRNVAIYARSESRPDKTDPQGGQTMDPAELRQSIGLPAEATDDQVRARLTELQTSAAAAAGEPAVTRQPDGTPQKVDQLPADVPTGAEPGGPAGVAQPETIPGAPSLAPAPGSDPAKAGESTGEDGKPVSASVTVPAEVWASVQAGAQRGNQVYEQEQKRLKDDTLHRACEEGRIAASQREQFSTLWDRDPTGTHKLLTASVNDGGLAPNLVPVQARGHNPSTEAEIAAAEAYPDSWLAPTERDRIAAATGRS